MGCCGIQSVHAWPLSDTDLCRVHSAHLERLRSVCQPTSTPKSRLKRRWATRNTQLPMIIWMFSTIILFTTGKMACRCRHASGRWIHRTVASEGCSGSRDGRASLSSMFPEALWKPSRGAARGGQSTHVEELRAKPASHQTRSILEHQPRGLST